MPVVVLPRHRGSVVVFAAAAFAGAALVGCAVPPTPGNDETPDTESPEALALEVCGQEEPTPEDPGASVDGWSAVGGAVIDYNGVGALFLSEAVCSGDAEMRKTVMMPSCFMPLALDVQSNIVSSEAFGSIDATGVSLGGALLDFGYGEFETTRCVGARAFRGEGDLIIRPRTAYSLCEEAIGEVASVSLRPEPLCPAPGTTVPFPQWTLGANEGTRAEVVNGNLELEIEAGTCADARAEGPTLGALALPDVAGSGFTLVIEGDAEFEPEDFDGGLYLRIGRTSAKLHGGSNTICLPRAMQGSTNRLSLILTHESCSASSAPPRLAIVHPIEMIDTCPDSDVVDGDFTEASPLWRTVQQYQPGSARIEGGVATLEAAFQCDNPLIQGVISVPTPTASGGPAVRAHYALSGPGIASIYSGEVNVSGELSSAATQATVCLPPQRAGDLLELTLSLTTETGGSGACAQPVPTPSRLDVDRVEVILDSGCPVD